MNWVFLISQSADQKKKDQPHSPIHTCKVDEGILPVVLLYFDGGDSTAARISWSVAAPLIKATFSNKPVREQMVLRSRTGMVIDGSKFGQSLLSRANF